MKALSRRKKKWLLILALGFVVWFLKRPHYRHFKGDLQVTPSWKTLSEERPGTGTGFEPRYVYSLVHTSGKTFQVAALEFGDLEMMRLERNGKVFLLTRFFGSGSSNAYYFSVYRILPDAIETMTASERLDWGDDEPCLTSPRALPPPKDPVEVFGDCSSPKVYSDRLVFHQPGWHCGFIGQGGCPSRTTVKLE